MKKAMNRWAEKMMEKAHKTAQEYQRIMGSNKYVTPAKKAASCGNYFWDMK